MTTRYWSNKQIGRHRGSKPFEGFNKKRFASSTERFGRTRGKITHTSESDLGVTPFGCTGFFIPSTKMKSKRRQSDPFVNTCSRKTFDLMRAIHPPLPSASQMPYQYLSRIMRLDNELKIIPEKWALSSKKIDLVA